MAASRLSARPLPSPCAPPGTTRNRNALTSISESAIYPTTWSVLMLWVNSYLFFLVKAFTNPSCERRFRRCRGKCFTCFGRPMRNNQPITQHERVYPAEQRLITTTNLKGIITYCNEAFIDISGFSREEADVRAAQPDPSPRRPAGGVRPHVDHPQSRPPVDGDRQEPLQERRPLLGQRLCHADLRPGRGGRLRVGAGQADRRTDPARRGPLPSPRRRQAGDPPARPLAAGTARLAAVHPDQPDRLPHRYLAELLVGLHPRRPARRSARPGRTALAEARAEAPDAARRTDHLRPADRADVHRQPRRPGAPGNGHPQPGRAPEDLPDAPAGHRRIPHRTGAPGRHPGPPQAPPVWNSSAQRPNRWPPRSTRWPPPPRKWRTMSS